MAESIAGVLLRAAELTAAGDPQAAITLLRPVVVAHPDHPEAWCRLAAAHVDNAEPQKALDAARHAIVLGERSWAHRLASLALLELGRTDEAEVSAREAVRRDASDWRCHVALAEVLVIADPAEALRVARRAVDLAGTEPRPYEVLGDVAVRAREITTAKWAYRQALRLDPESPHARTNLTRLVNHQPIVTGTSPVVAAKARPAAARLGSVSRTVLWLVIRRLSTWLGVGSFVLVLAGLPSPSQVLAWFGFALVIVLLVVAARAWVTLPERLRPDLRALPKAQPMLTTAAGFVGFGTVLLVVWTVSVALGSHGMTTLTVVVGCALVAALTATLGLAGRSAGR